jgi:lipopolysaccharide transport system permease protein
VLVISSARVQQRLNPFGTLTRHRRLLARTVADEIRQRYAGSMLGLFWVLLAPLLLMTIYATIYLLVFRVRSPGMSESEYVLYILAGLIPFIGFSEALNTGAGSLSLNKAILLSTVFPAELVPLRSVLASQASTAVGLALTLALSAALGHASPVALLVPIVWICLVLFVAGIVWVFALASLVVRDIQQVLGFALMALLVVSPIAYTLEMVPAMIRPLVYANPLSWFMFALHDLVFGRVPSPGVFAVLLAMSVGSFSAGFAVFQRAKRVMIDYA